jgi:hypothetical protein
MVLAPGETKGRSWLNSPVLHWDTSEIQCLCMVESHSWANVAPCSRRVKIEVWSKDIARIWRRDKPHRPKGPSLEAADAPLLNEMAELVDQGKVTSPDTGGAAGRLPS